MGVLRLFRKSNILENNIVQTAASAGESPINASTRGRVTGETRSCTAVSSLTGTYAFDHASSSLIAASWTSISA